MRVNFFTTAIITCVVLTIINAVINQVREGQPELVDAALRGVIVGTCMVSVQYWMARWKKTKSEGP